MRHRIARALHRLNVHLACREVREPMDWPSIRLDDGTLWKPDVSGFMTRRYHT